MSSAEGWRPPGGPGDSLVLGAPFLPCCPHSSGPLRLGMKIITEFKTPAGGSAKKRIRGPPAHRCGGTHSPRAQRRLPPPLQTMGGGHFVTLTPPCPPPAPSLPWLWSEEEGNASSMPAAQKGKQLSSEGKLPGQHDPLFVRTYCRSQEALPGRAEVPLEREWILIGGLYLRAAFPLNVKGHAGVPPCRPHPPGRPRAG